MYVKRRTLTKQRKRRYNSKKVNIVGSDRDCFFAVSLRDGGPLDS